MDEDERMTELANHLVWKLNLFALKALSERSNLLQHLRRDLLLLELDAENTQIRHLGESGTDISPAFRILGKTGCEPADPREPLIIRVMDEGCGTQCFGKREKALMAIAEGHAQEKVVHTRELLDLTIRATKRGTG